MSDDVEARFAAHRELHRMDRAALVANYEERVRVLQEQLSELQARYVPRLRRNTRLLAKAQTMSVRFRDYMAKLKRARERRT